MGTVEPLHRITQRARHNEALGAIFEEDGVLHVRYFVQEGQGNWDQRTSRAVDLFPFESLRLFAVDGRAQSPFACSERFQWDKSDTRSKYDKCITPAACRISGASNG
jgi:hypothetical protein